MWVLVLKNCEPELLHLLVELFKMYLKESYFQDLIQKVSSVDPVFKNVGEAFTARNTTLLVFFLWLTKSLQNLLIIGLFVYSTN